MQYLGIDLHKKGFVAVGMDENGEVFHKDKYDNTYEQLINLLACCKQTCRYGRASRLPELVRHPGQRPYTPF
mgnify:CR=1 FL=1